MAHTHEYDCIVCGAHFDSQEELARHDQHAHEPKTEPDPRSAEPIGTEQRREPSRDE